MIIPFIVLFFPPAALRETNSIYNIAHILSRVSNVTQKRQEQKKKKKQRV